eukprot:TRINITY_DN20306_c0_g1_i1.p3 TRINITY_DN20306_c0_g1~~TRINITY_DN20306_c0_g1_i1.p3  ORF type:complete len:179 (+),score=18.79 TRINITY_DN20306_c0_g1_i1:117-653(+)
MASTVQSLSMASMSVAATVPTAVRSSNTAQTTLVQPAGLRVAAGLPSLRSRDRSLPESSAVPLAGSSGRGPRRNDISARAAATKTAYICRDCGYIYNERKSFDSLTSDYSCPVCAAPKRRFKTYDAPVSKNANSDSVRKARKADLKAADSSLGDALPIAVTVGAAALVGTFLYLNSQF